MFLDPAGSSKPLLSDAEIEELKPTFDIHDKTKNVYEVFLDLLKLNSWFSDERLVKVLETPLMRLCAEYLFVVKRRGYALDPVGKNSLETIGMFLW